MEQILLVVDSERFSLLDGFSGYNQVLVKEEDQFKTAFTTKWGTMAYRRMPFGLSNAGTTFQRAMDMAFQSLINRIMLIYLDDITVYSKNADGHLSHLKQVFKNCREFGISLNPKKSIFAVHEGKLLGHIVSKKGITIDLERVKAILELSLPNHKKGLQSFLGQINFIRRFIPNVANLLQPLTAMLKKSAVFRWTGEAKHSFEKVKEALASTPTLVNPNFSKDFFLYAFGSTSSIFAMLVQKNRDNSKQPIAFFSQVLADYEEKYTFVEKHVLVVIKSLKKFKPLISNNKIHILVAHSSVKEFLLNKYLNEKRAGWITKVMEYDVDIKITKLVRGKGLCEQLATGSSSESELEKDVVLANTNESQNAQDDVPLITKNWVQDMTQFLQTGECPL